MKPPKFTAVVHMTGDDQAVEQSTRVLEAGAGGVFLIDHERSFRHVLASYEKVRAALPNAWIGINFLDLLPDEAIQVMPAGAQALWIDYGGIEEGRESQPEADQNLKHIRAAKPGVLLFAGVAFKYQQKVKNPAAVAALASTRMDVVTTSGAGTGEAPSVEKIVSMKKALLPGGLLAVASGVSPENVHLYRDDVDCFMVATSISKTFDTFDLDKVRAFAAALA
jgi:predicted TIM-barrel enzyme